MEFFPWQVHDMFNFWQTLILFKCLTDYPTSCYKTENIVVTQPLLFPD